MFKKTTQVLAAASVLFSFHTLASATCTPGKPDCASNVSVNNTIKSNYDIQGNHSGVYVQLNKGASLSEVKLTRVLTPASGQVTARADSIGNNFSAFFEGSTLPLSHVVQTNSGAQGASVTMTLHPSSTPEAVALTSFAIGNNLNTEVQLGTTLKDFSAIQCNNAEITAKSSFVHDPVKLNVNSVAYGNNISLSAYK